MFERFRDHKGSIKENATTAVGKHFFILDMINVIYKLYLLNIFEAQTLGLECPGRNIILEN